MILYHGSNIAIDVIDLSIASRGKDFGMGFYMSDSEDQAYKMAEVRVARKKIGNPIVTKFRFDETILDKQDFKVKKFDSYTEEWAKFILTNRQNKSSIQSHDYDIVIGPIANDKIGVQIYRLLKGYIPIERFIEEIKYIEPTIQYFFCTEKVIKELIRL